VIDRIEPVPDRGPVVEPIARPRLLTPVEREQERRRREERRKQRQNGSRTPRDAPSGGRPGLDVRG
jgi:hypothetical protein